MTNIHPGHVLLVNCSWPYYNLGVAKMKNWFSQQGHTVVISNKHPGMFTEGYDLVALSVIFSWHAPIALDIALRVKAHSEVWVGGPGMFALKNWWKQRTGLECHQGLDWRFERQRGIYEMTFASRGCPVNCSFCIVPRIEGTSFTLDWEFQPAPILADNNLSALPLEFQKHIISCYQRQGVPLQDANSGFEPRTFTDEIYRLWQPLLRGPWRFALDEMGEIEDVRRMMTILGKERPGKKRVYVLIGNEPFENCYERAQKVLEWGGEPFCQPMMSLNTLVKQPRPAFGWTQQALKDFARYYNRWIWRICPLSDYRPRRFEPPLFAGFRANAPLLGRG